MADTAVGVAAETAGAEKAAAVGVAVEKAGVEKAGALGMNAEMGDELVGADGADVSVASDVCERWRIGNVSMELSDSLRNAVRARFDAPCCVLARFM